MPKEDGNVWITYNGEFYSFGEHRQGYEARGIRFRSRTDTEVILHLYRDHGKEFVHFLRSMFALGLWDEGRQELILVRDRFGTKPIYFYNHQKGSYSPPKSKRSLSTPM